jgi:hypothetical protein
MNVVKEEVTEAGGTPLVQKRRVSYRRREGREVLSLHLSLGGGK